MYTRNRLGNTLFPFLIPTHVICTSPLVIFFYFCHITHLPLIIFFLISVLSSVFFYFLFLFFSDPHTTCLFSTSQFFIYFFAVCAHFILFKCSSSPSSLFFLFFFTWSVESIHNLSVQCAYHRRPVLIEMR